MSELCHDDDRRVRNNDQDSFSMPYKPLQDELGRTLCIDVKLHTTDELDVHRKLHKNGSMEFVVPATDGDNFFPIDVDFSSNATLCDVKVDAVTRTTDGGAVKFFGESKLVCDGYSVV